MSIQFSDTTNKNGIIQSIEDECGFNDGDITDDATMLAKFTGDVNRALDEIYALIFKSGGVWQFDDINHSKYPFIETALISGQRDYAFTNDEQGNLILDIYKVMVKDANGVYQELDQVDQQAKSTNRVNVDSFSNGLDTQGTPIRYDMTANGIFLDPIPNYSWSGDDKGVKVFINREGSYFATSDTTKKAGFNGLFHYLLVLLPAYKYARIHSLPQVTRIENDIMKMKGELTDSYGQRSRDITRRLIPNRENNK